MASSPAPELCTPTGPGLHKPAGSPGEGAHLRPCGRLQGPWVRDQGGTETPSLGRPDVAALQAGGAGPPRGAWARRTVGPLSAVAGSSLQTLTSHPLAALTPLTHVPLFTRYRPARGGRARSWGPRPLVGAALSGVSPLALCCTAEVSGLLAGPAGACAPWRDLRCSDLSAESSLVCRLSHLGSPGLNSALAFLSPHFLAHDLSRLTLQQDHCLSSADSFQDKIDKTHGRESGRVRPGAHGECFHGAHGDRVSGRGVPGPTHCASASGVCPKAHKVRSDL